MAKTFNGYAESLGAALYENTPKAVFAAIAISFALRLCEEESFVLATNKVLAEWDTLHKNGIVPQKPPKQEAQ